MSNVSFPNTKQPFLDPNTGQVSRVWLMFFNDMFRRIGGGSAPDLSALIQSLNGVQAGVKALESEIESAPPAGAFLAGVLAAIECIGAQIAEGRAASDVQQDERGETGDASGVAHLRSRIQHLEAQIEQLSGASGNARIDEIEAVAAAGVTQADAPVTTVAGRTGDVLLAVADVSGAAPTASPNFSGTVTYGTVSQVLVNDGYMSIGGALASNAQLYIRGANQGNNASQFGVQANGEFNATATTAAYTFNSQPKVKDATFTLPILYGFRATAPTKGASATITSYEAVSVADAAVGATNIAYRASMASGTNKWNLYADGTARNYLNGALSIGSTTDDGSGNKLQVSTGISISPTTTTTAPAAGAAGALPATPTGYATIRIGGTDRKIAYY
jgi:hypothetical protein